MADIEIEIDGKTLTAAPNETVMQVADKAGIYIPRFCYHKHLSIAANCRMCLVEVEKSPKALPACATPVMQGMKVFTKSQKTIEAQRAVMEFLLINHPLDCPICDQGGECELQDLSMGYGSSHSKYDECKRSVADQNLGPLIATEMTRCIHCTRCVRFGDEIAGMRELGVNFRGENAEITTYIKHAIKSEVSGNIIDLCPVGALTSKPYRFRARPWELDQAKSISPHDCIGSHIFVHTRYGKVMRVVANENADINQTWISDRDRFSYAGLHHDDRLEDPLIRVNGEWQITDWQTALETAAKGLQDVVSEFGADKLGALASPSSTVEEFYLLQKLIRGLGSPHIDHRLRQKDTRDQNAMGTFPGLGMSIDEFEQCDAFLLIGCNLQKEQPIAALRLRNAIKNGANVFVVNSVDYQFNFKVDAKQIVAPGKMVEVLKNFDPALLENLKSKKKICIILGAQALHHYDGAAIRYAANQIAIKLNTKVSLLTDGANSAGAWIAGAIPHRHACHIEPINHIGLNAYEMLEKPRKAYLLLNVEPDFDCANPHLATEALAQAKFVVSLSVFSNPIIKQQADVILPIASFAETSGTYVNAEGKWQSFSGVAKPFALSRPAWKLLRVLGNFLHLKEFDYESSEVIRDEVKALYEKMTSSSHSSSTLDLAPARVSSTQLERIGEIPIYAIDALVRRSNPLQETQKIMEGDVDEVRIHPDTAKALGLLNEKIVSVRQPHTKTIEMPLKLDSRLATNAAVISGSIEKTRELGDLFGEVELLSVNN